MRVVMDQAAIGNLGSHPFSYVIAQGFGTALVHEPRFFAEFMGAGADHLRGLAVAWLVAVFQITEGEIQQDLPQRRLTAGRERGCRGGDMQLHRLAQQVALAAIAAVEGLLGAAGLGGHRVHAQPHALDGQQLAHGVEHALVAGVVGAGVGVGGLHRVWTIPSSTELIQVFRRLETGGDEAEMLWASDRFRHRENVRARAAR